MMRRAIFGGALVCILLVGTLAARQVGWIDGGLGIRFTAGPWVLSGSADPAADTRATAAPYGSLYCRSNTTSSTCYVKTSDTAGTTWTAIGSGTGTVTHTGSLTANLPVIGNGSADVTVGTRSGNTTSFATTSGSLTDGNCAAFDADGNVVDAATTCGGGGGTAGADFSGSGHPQGVQTGVGGQTYRDTATGILYIKKSLGSSNTGWYPAVTIGPGAVDGPQFGWAMAQNNNSGGQPTSYGAFDTIATTGNVGITSSFSATWWDQSNTTGASGDISGWQAASLVAKYWAYDFDLAIRVRTDSSSISTVRYWVGLTSSAVTNSGSLTASGTAFRYDPSVDSGWVGYTRDGTSETVSSTVASIATSTPYVLRIRYVASGTPTVYFSVNDCAEVAVTTTLPATTTTPLLTITQTATTAVTYHMFFKSLGIWYGS